MIPFLFLGYYFIRKARESYAFNNKFRWINEKRKPPEGKNNPKSNMLESKYENSNQKSPIPTMISPDNLKK